METSDAMRSRFSVRGYLDKPVPEELIREILDDARWAPSGVNTQPWRVEVVTGAARERLSEALIAERRSGREANPDYTYYPAEWHEPYAGRRRACGLALYRALNIGRDDPEGRTRAWNNNYRFFGAPAGLLVFVHREMGTGAWIDTGMFLQNCILAAQTRGLATCPQAALAEYPGIVRGQLGVGDEWAMVCGIALGYADPEHPANSYRLERIEVDEFTTFHR